MKRNLFQVIPLTGLFFLLFLTAPHAKDREGISQEVAQALQVCELYYEDGRYQEALSRCQKLLKKYSGKGYTKLLIKPTLAKYYLAMGNFLAFGKETSSYLSQVKTYRKEDSPAYGHALLDVAELYLMYGNLEQVRSYLEKAKANFKSRKNAPELRIMSLEARLAFAQGDYQQAETLLGQLKGEEAALTSASRQVFNPLTNELETTELNEAEKRSRLNDYGSLLNLRADAARLQGDFQQAQQYAEEAHQWILDKLSNRDLAYIENRHITLLLRLDRGDSRRSIGKKLDQLLFRSEKMLGKAHKLHFAIQETVIDYFIESKYLKKQNSDKGNFLQLDFLTRNRERRQSNFQLWDINQSSKLYYGKDRLRYAMTQRLEAKQEMRRQNFKAAEELLLPLYEDHKIIPILHPGRAIVARQLYTIKREQSQLEEARKYLDQYLEAAKTVYGQESLYYQMAQLEKANFLYSYTNAFDSAKLILSQYVPKIRERLTPVQARALKTNNEWADYYEITDNYEQSAKLIDENLRHIEKTYGKKHPRYAAQLTRKADLMMLQSRYTEVDSLLGQIQLIFEEDFNPNLNEDYALALETSAHYKAIMGLYDDAKSELQEARNQYFLHAGLFNRFRDLESAAFSENADELAYLYIQSEEYERAEEILNLIIEKRKSTYGEKSRFLVKPYNELARLKRIEGDYTQADAYISLAYDIAVANYGDQSLKVTESLEILSDIKTSIGDYEGAKIHAEEALKIKQTILGERNIGLANTYVQLAIIKYNNKENWEEVNELLTKAETVARRNLGQQNPVYAGILQKTASIYLEKGDDDKAEENLLQARRTWLVLSKESARKKIADIDVLIAQVDVRKGKLEDAEEKLKEALKDYKSIFSREHPDYIRTRAAMARLYFQKEEFDKAESNIQFVLEAHKNYIRESFPVLSDREKSKAWSLRRDDFEFFTNFAIQRAESKPELLELLYDNLLITKSVLLSASKSVRNKILNSGNDSLIANYNRWIDLKNELVRSVGLSQEQLKESGIDIRELQGQVDDLEKVLSRQSNDFTSQEARISWENVRDVLEPQDYALEVFRFRHYQNRFTDSIGYAALIINGSSSRPELVKIPNGEALEGRYLKIYRNSMRYSVPDYTSYDNFWKPIDEVIPDGSRIYFSADKAYTQINVESLALDDGGYLIDKDNVLLVTTTKDLLAVKQRDQEKRGLPKRMALFGNPKFYPDFVEGEGEGAMMRDQSSDRIKPLPGAQREVEAIAASVQANEKLLFVQEEASETRVKRLTQTERPMLYHFATHGFFEPDISDEQRAALRRLNASDNPLLRSGLLFKDAGLLMQNANYHEYNREPGVLTAYEVASMNFDGADVLMSACETGLGDVKVGEGVYGLQRAFQIAGAGKLIMSLFKVDDEATRALMELFYKKWEESGNMQDAFREAKRELRKEFPEPIYWGAFVMVGG